MACEVKLLAEADRLVARGVVPIDSREGPPAVICWKGWIFLQIPGEPVYRKARAMHADARFEAVR